MTSMLKTLANGKLVLVLEGGYNIRSLENSVVAVTKTLIGDRLDNIPDVNDDILSKSCVKTCKEIKRKLSKFWDCFGEEFIEYEDDLDYEEDIVPVTGSIFQVGIN